MNNFFDILLKSNLDSAEIKRIKNEVLFPNIEHIEIFDKKKKLLGKINLRQVRHIKWGIFKNIQHYFKWRKERCLELKQFDFNHIYPYYPTDLYVWDWHIKKIKQGKLKIIQ